MSLAPAGGPAHGYLARRRTTRLVVVRGTVSASSATLRHKREGPCANRQRALRTSYLATKSFRTRNWPDDSTLAK